MALLMLLGYASKRCISGSRLIIIFCGVCVCEFCVCVCVYLFLTCLSPCFFSGLFSSGFHGLVFLDDKLLDFTFKQYPVSFD